MTNERAKSSHRADVRNVAAALIAIVALLMTGGGSAESRNYCEACSPAPDAPWKIRRADRPTVVFLHAPWCQWCNVLGEETLPSAPVEDVLGQRFVALDVDVDRAPAWMDLPGIAGLPAQVFFSPSGEHVLTRSGYRGPKDMAIHLKAIADKIEAGELDPYGKHKPIRLGKDTIDGQEASRELDRLEKAVFLAVNSNDGGFESPARVPHPDLLRVLQRWRAAGAPARVEKWIGLTARKSLRGSSPRLRGEPLADMDFDAAELRRLSRKGAAAGDRWREGIERLPGADPYLGIQDQFDHGVFRYAAGPGWYHPHFERRALDNLSWSLLLQERGRRDEARRIAEYVESTFADSGLLNATQHSDPFYYRLREDERQDLEPPDVDRLWLLKVQARAARLFPERCALLDRVPTDRWPRSIWTVSGESADSPDAMPDAVGELLLALTECGRTRRARALAKTVAFHWRTRPFDWSPRLHRLAAGICRARPPECRQVLQTIHSLPFEPDYAPPFVALHRIAAD